nr:hypothetical protein [Tanacetum cinerariifolium]
WTTPTLLWKNTSGSKKNKLIGMVRSMETEFPVIVFNDKLTSKEALSCKPTDFKNEFPATVYNDALKFKSDPSTEPVEIPHRIDEFDLKTKTSLSKSEGLSGRMLMENIDAQGQSVFTSRAWRRLFEIQGPLVHEVILKFFSTFRFGEALVDLDTVDEMKTYRDPMLTLCHRLIACSIAERSQAPEKVTVTDLFYLRGTDVGLVSAWVAPRPERQPNAAVGLLEAAGMLLKLMRVLWMIQNLCRHRNHHMLSPGLCLRGSLRFVLDCVLSSTAFCLFKDHLLRFAKDKLCQTQNCIAFCLKRLRFEESCVLPQKCCDLILRFAIADLAFCYRRIMRFAIQDTAFCLE